MIKRFRKYLKEINSIQKFEYVVKKFPNINKDDFIQIVKADPTSSPEKDGEFAKVGSYVDWLLKLYVSNKLKQEDLDKAKEYLEIFDKKKQKLQDVKLRDINHYPSLSDLYVNAVKQLSEVQTKTEKIQAERKDVTTIYDGAEWLIIVPKSYEASCRWGKGTQWCTASGKTERFYKQYSEEGPLFIIINKKDPTIKYQFHFETQSFMDRDDRSVVNEIKDFPDFAKKTFGNDVFNVFAKYREKQLKSKDIVDEDEQFYLVRREKTKYYLISKKNVFDEKFLTDLSGTDLGGDVPENFLKKLVIEKLKILKTAFGDLFPPVKIDGSKVKFKIARINSYYNYSSPLQDMIGNFLENSSHYAIIHDILFEHHHRYDEDKKPYDFTIPFANRIEKEVEKIYPDYKKDGFKDYKDLFQRWYQIKDDEHKTDTKIHQLERDLSIDNIRKFFKEKDYIKKIGEDIIDIINKVSPDFKITKEEDGYYGEFDYEKNPEYLFHISIGQRKQWDRRKKSLENFYGVMVAPMVKELKPDETMIKKIVEFIEKGVKEYIDTIL